MTVVIDIFLVVTNITDVLVAVAPISAQITAIVPDIFFIL